VREEEREAEVSATLKLVVEGFEIRTRTRDCPSGNLAKIFTNVASARHGGWYFSQYKEFIFRFRWRPRQSAKLFVGHTLNFSDVQIFHKTSRANAWLYHWNAPC
jgi:hypothetical protein